MDYLFAYGTLMCRDIMQDVSGCHLPSRPGLLRDYSRRAVKGEHYPAIVKESGNRVEGIIYRGVPRSGWDRLDRFEGEGYVRQLVNIELPDGSTTGAQTYVTNPTCLYTLESFEWDYEQFLRTKKEDFKTRYEGFQQI